MDRALVSCPAWPAPAGRQPAGSAFPWVWLLWGLPWACVLAELVRLVLWLASIRKYSGRHHVSDKAIQVDLPVCKLEAVMTMTVEAIREELAGFQASKAGTKETLAERLCDFRKKAMLQ